MTVLLQCLSPRPMARARLLLVPFAGAGPSAFTGLVRALGPSIEPWGAALPGREGLSNEPFLSRWADAVAGLKAAAAAAPLPFTAVYGHSIGAALVADSFRETEGLRIALGAPPVTGPKACDADTLEGVYGPLPASMSDPDIAAYARPILEADLALLGARPARPLTADLVLLGENDPSSADHRTAFDGTETVTVPGGHYFPVDHPQATADALTRWLIPPAD